MTQSLEITQVRSLIGAKSAQRATVRSLGLRRIRHTVIQPDRPEIRGMLAKVAHLVAVRYVDADEVIDLEPGQEPKGPDAPPAGASVADEDATALREAEEEALAGPGSTGDAPETEDEDQQ
jgi:large subunit ribosomal protein L30